MTQALAQDIKYFENIKDQQISLKIAAKDFFSTIRTDLSLSRWDNKVYNRRFVQFLDTYQPKSPYKAYISKKTIFDSPSISFEVTTGLTREYQGISICGDDLLREDGKRINLPKIIAKLDNKISALESELKSLEECDISEAVQRYNDLSNEVKYFNSHIPPELMELKLRV